MNGVLRGKTEKYLEAWLAAVLAGHAEGHTHPPSVVLAQTMATVLIALTVREWTSGSTGALGTYDVNQI